MNQYSLKMENVPRHFMEIQRIFGTYIYQVVRDGRECRFVITLILYTVYGFLSN